MARILIVEDEAPQRDLLAVIFDEAGYKVQRAIHGRQALDIIAEELPDLVISDVMMPVMDGLQLCHWLKSNRATKNIPVILMSAAGSRIADGAGADAFVGKPFSLDDLEALVARLLAATARE